MIHNKTWTFVSVGINFQHVDEIVQQNGNYQIKY